LEHRVLDDLGRALIETASNYDVLVIDTGAGIGPATMHFLGLAHEIIIVSTPNLAATLDAYGMIKCIHERNLSGQLHLLVNLADEMKAADAVFTRIAGCARQFLQRPVSRLGVLLHDTRVEAANQSRTPLLVRDPSHESAVQLSRIAAQLVPAAAPRRASSAA
jgi:flagellar biosynthesis protein FlhG